MVSQTGPVPSASEKKLINELVKHYIENLGLYRVMLDQVTGAIEGSETLMTQAHSIKSRLKDPKHLKEKLLRKLRTSKSQGGKFSVNKQNIFLKINDLAGVRILHLHTQQFPKIDSELRRIFTEYQWPLIERPTARTWDDEYRAFFTNAGIKAVKSPSFYTSVHYVIKSSNKTALTCEIQVRTLAEELWGEVDHTLNYPRPSTNSSCKEQIKVLARVTSSCSRLVDSIFAAKGRKKA